MSPLAYSLLLAHLANVSPQQSPNVCLSPYSLQSAFALVQEGACGTTQSEIEQVLHTSHFSSIASVTPLTDEGVTFSQANSIWINAERSPKIKRAFLKANQKKYKAEVKSLTFDESARLAINAWCAQQTQNHIPEAIDRLNPMEFMKLINAIYFKGTWTKEFQSRLTRQEDFYSPAAEGEPIQVDMMHTTNHFDYGEDERCQIIELPFLSSIDQDQYALQVILPREDGTLTEFTRSLADGYQLPVMNYDKVKLSLPKFELNYSADLIPTLQYMGLQTPFSQQADFCNLCQGDVFVSSVNQKTFFKVDEQGAEAAAVTAVGMMLKSVAPRPERVFEMTVDHPFLIQLVNKSQDLILFLATITNPNK